MQTIVSIKQIYILTSWSGVPSTRLYSSTLRAGGPSRQRFTMWLLEIYSFCNLITKNSTFIYRKYLDEYSNYWILFILILIFIEQSQIYRETEYIFIRTHLFIFMLWISFWIPTLTSGTLCKILPLHFERKHIKFPTFPLGC